MCLPIQRHVSVLHICTSTEYLYIQLWWLSKSRSAFPLDSPKTSGTSLPGAAQGTKTLFDRTEIDAVVYVIMCFRVTPSLWMLSCDYRHPHDVQCIITSKMCHFHFSSGCKFLGKSNFKQFPPTEMHNSCCCHSGLDSVSPNLHLLFFSAHFQSPLPSTGDQSYQGQITAVVSVTAL